MNTTEISNPDMKAYQPAIKTLKYLFVHESKRGWFELFSTCLNKLGGYLTSSENPAEKLLRRAMESGAYSRKEINTFLRKLARYLQSPDFQAQSAIGHEVYPYRSPQPMEEAVIYLSNFLRVFKTPHDTSTQAQVLFYRILLSELLVQARLKPKSQLNQI